MAIEQRPRSAANAATPRGVNAERQHVHRLPTLSLTAPPMHTTAPAQTRRRPHICIGSVARALIVQRPLEVVDDVLDLRERRRPVEIPRLVS